MPRALRIVIGAHAFAHPGGTETYAFTVARELQRIGHEPVICADELGEMADRAERSALAVARSGPPAGCDAVLAQDAIAAATLAERFPQARVVQVAHSDLHDHQLPVLLEDVLDAVVVMSDRIAARVAALPLTAPVVRLRQPIDTELYKPRTPIGTRPRRALLLSNYLDGPRCRALTGAWEAAGVGCVQVGAPAQHSLDPSDAIAEADVVVGKGRAALEGMSCARAVYVFDEYGGDGWVTPAAYEAMEADNFAGFANDGPRTPDDLAADLAGYDEAMGWLNRELVKEHHGARRHALELVQLLSGGPAQAPRSPEPLAEVARLTRAAWQAERRTMSAEAEVVRLRERTLSAEAELAELHERAAAQGRSYEAAVTAAAADAEAWRARAEDAERRLDEARALIASRRVGVGLAAGKAVDRVLRRR